MTTVVTYHRDLSTWALNLRRQNVSLLALNLHDLGIVHDDFNRSKADASECESNRLLDYLMVLPI